MEPVHFSLSGADGVDHSYIVVPHPTSLAVPIVLEILGMLAPSLVQLLVAGVEGGLDSDFETLLREMDMSVLGRDLQASFHSLSPETIRGLFVRTIRDGKELQQVAAYDTAYAGNITEFLKAIQKIVSINGFIPFLSTLQPASTTTPSP